jgi:hypothetical protein
VRRLGAVLVAALALAGAAHAAPAPTAPVYDEAGRLVDAPFAPVPGTALLTAAIATEQFLADPKVAGWVDRYPPKPVTDAVYDATTGDWEVKVWSGEAGQIAEGRVDDTTSRVEEAWTGPQVAWKMARGGSGAFGGKTLNRPVVWLAFCAIFLVGLVDWRRLLRARNVDLLALLAFTISLRFFNEGDIFTSVPLAYPPMAWLLGRMLWLGLRGRPERTSPPVWPVWLLAGAAVFLAGFRVGLNVEAQRTVIDVGYAGVIGAQRITNGQAPYGNMPVQGSLKPCGAADSKGEIRERIQTNGRCESSNDRGDTYGPVTYLAYLPGYVAFGWSGKWDTLPAAHATSILFDLLAMVGLALVGLRFGGARLAATLAFAWAAYPFTQYVSNANSNDAIMPALLIWGFWLSSSAWARGAAVALAGWTKFAALLLAPLWLGYPDGLRWPASWRLPGRRGAPAVGVANTVGESTVRGAITAREGREAARPRSGPVEGSRGNREIPPALPATSGRFLEPSRVGHFVAGFALATLVAFAILLLEPDPLHAARVFGERTLGFQLDRESPFSLWGWGQYHAAGIPDLHLVQVGLELVLVALALGVAFYPRRKGPLELAALTAALLLGFELVLTHWFYLYIPWFFPFVVVALFLAAPHHRTHGDKA